ncbi:YbjN domain-containing protein [Psychrobacter glacincola]|uniref:YbjN domain-containing protein n=1 Tax=Psychrobacter glacincola TaxID=56810 RepID=A0ABW1WAX5_9GAMM|nr:YbjN domain-containing protein [Psychrobacter glacincola]
MSQRNKLSLWQKMKQLLTASTVRFVIDNIKSSKDLTSADFDEIDEIDSQVSASQVATDNVSTDKVSTDNINTNHKENDPNNIDSAVSDKNASRADTNVADNIETMNKSIEVETDIDTAIGKDLQNSAEQKSDSDIPIVDYLKQYFDDKEWHYNHYQPKIRDSQKSHYLSLRMRNKRLDCGYLFRVQERNKLLAVYGILPFLIPESHQSAAMLLMTQINYDMVIGNLEMDVNDGEIRYKNAIDIEAVGLDDDILEHLLQSIVAMTTVAHEIFSDLVNNQNPAEELPDLLLQLRKQADSRTFFLPTQFVQ